MLYNFILRWYYNHTQAQICAYNNNKSINLEDKKMEKYLENYPPVLSVDDVAGILGITPKTVRNLIKNGEIAGIKVGRLIRIPKDRLVEYLERGTVT